MMVNLWVIIGSDNDDYLPFYGSKWESAADIVALVPNNLSGRNWNISPGAVGTLTKSIPYNLNLSYNVADFYKVFCIYTIYSVI